MIFPSNQTDWEEFLNWHRCPHLICQTVTGTGMIIFRIPLVLSASSKLPSFDKSHFLDPLPSDEQEGTWGRKPTTAAPLWCTTDCLEPLTSSTWACVCCSRLLLDTLVAGGGPAAPAAPVGPWVEAGTDLDQNQRM